MIQEPEFLGSNKHFLSCLREIRFPSLRSSLIVCSSPPAYRTTIWPTSCGTSPPRWAPTLILGVSRDKRPFGNFLLASVFTSWTSSWFSKRWHQIHTHMQIHTQINWAKTQMKPSGWCFLFFSYLFFILSSISCCFRCFWLPWQTCRWGTAWLMSTPGECLQTSMSFAWWDMMQISSTKPVILYVLCK